MTVVEQAIALAGAVSLATVFLVGLVTVLRLVHRMWKR